MSSSARERIEGHIETHGVSLVGVGEGDEPDFIYTIGLARRGMPEIIVFSLPFHTAGIILNKLARSMINGLTVVEPYVRVHDLISKFPVVFIPVKGENYWPYLAQAIYFYEPESFVAYQMVWPDKTGRFHWELEDDHFHEVQPLLGYWRAPGSQVD